MPQREDAGWPKYQSSAMHDEVTDVLAVSIVFVISEPIHFPTHRVARLYNILFVFVNYIQVKTKK